MGRQNLPEPGTLTHCPACGGKWGSVDNTCECHAAQILAGYLAQGYVLKHGRPVVPDATTEAREGDAA